MANSYFRFKQFTIQQDACAMKVTTDACLFGAWCAAEVESQKAVGKTLLDIGTGTGLLSLMMRQKNAVKIEAVEIDASAAAQAQQNAAASRWHDSIHICSGNVLGMGVLKSFDYIISNPPFYEGELQSPDHRRNTAHHSSELSLKALISFMAHHLKANGTFFLLLPYKRSEEAHILLQENNLFICNEVTMKQTHAHFPFRVMLQGGFKQEAPKTATIIIAGTDQQYTPEFTALLKDYYLYL